LNKVMPPAKILAGGIQFNQIFIVSGLYSAVPLIAADCVPAESVTVNVTAFNPAGWLVSGLNWIPIMQLAPGAKVAPQVVPAFE
jgi:hypothetical protein